ncbi:MAG: transcription elongation factor GreA [Patescibacteria group bacterium]|nr:transcription elongation factor GreA [Patescibacteria group bacterium]
MKTDKKILFTNEGYKKLLEKQERFLRERPEAVENLRKAREMGDLSENGYYKAARARLSFIDAQLRIINNALQRAKVVNTGQNGFVSIGSLVTIDDGERKITYTIGGDYESDPLNKIISYQSPVGRSLMNKKVGDVVEVQTPRGMKKFIIVSVEYHEE